MKAFWRNGFDNTSVDQLAEAMGIGRPSMYNAFGDKDAIFLRCLAHYDASVVAPLLRAVQNAPTAAEGIASYLTMVATGTTTDPQHRGCFLVSTVVDDPKVQEFLAQRLDEATRVIAERLTAGVTAGELPADFPVAARARRAVNAMLAIAARAKRGAPSEELLADARDGAAMVVGRVAPNAP
jgi:AcrR family transcriptional regulator